MDDLEANRIKLVIRDQYKKIKDPKLTSEQRRILDDFIKELENKLIRYYYEKR